MVNSYRGSLTDGLLSRQDHVWEASFLPEPEDLPTQQERQYLLPHKIRTEEADANLINYAKNIIDDIDRYNRRITGCVKGVLEDLHVKKEEFDAAKVYIRDKQYMRQNHAERAEHLNRINQMFYSVLVL